MVVISTSFEQLDPTHDPVKSFTPSFGYHDAKLSSKLSALLHPVEDSVALLEQQLVFVRRGNSIVFPVAFPRRMLVVTFFVVPFFIHFIAFVIPDIVL